MNNDDDDKETTNGKKEKRKKRREPRFIVISLCPWLVKEHSRREGMVGETGRLVERSTGVGFFGDSFVAGWGMGILRLDHVPPFLCGAFVFAKCAGCGVVVCLSHFSLSLSLLFDYSPFLWLWWCLFLQYKCRSLIPPWDAQPIT